MKGIFITFEGTEGCGKSTQSRLLYEFLKGQGKDVLYLREPGGVKISEKIRSLLLDRKSRINPVCETLLYMAARAEVVSDVIEPALSHGKIVICDRFLDSTIAYQGFGLGIDTGLIKSIGRFATLGIKPGLTILLDIPVARGLHHRLGSKDRIEARNLAYHRRVKNGYLALARAERGRIVIIKVKKDILTTQGNIQAAVLKRCHLKISAARKAR